MKKKGSKDKGVSADDMVDFELLDIYQKKYRTETRLIFAGEMNNTHISANLYLANVTIHNETNEVCYIPYTEEVWYRRVTPINLTQYLISDDYTDSLIKQSQEKLKEKLIEHSKLLSSIPFYASELLKGGKNHHLYLEHHSDSNNSYKVDYMKAELDDTSPYY